MPDLRNLSASRSTGAEPGDVRAVGKSATAPVKLSAVEGGDLADRACDSGSGACVALRVGAGGVGSVGEREGSAGGPSLARA